jgi:hypothetical protein
MNLFWTLLILDSLFLNEPNPTIPVEDWKRIEAQSLLSTGVIQQEEVESLIFCNDWNPSGTISIWDDALSATIPGKKVKVKASRFFKYWTGYTNNAGYFILPDFCGEVRYSIIWENQIWDIRNKKGQQATTEGPRQRAPWNPVLKDDKEALGFALFTEH